MANNINELIIKENEKRERKYNAIKLPENLNQNMLPKYVGYYKECYNVEKKLYREFFKIEKHPNMVKHKVYVSSKSNKITLLEKLEQIKKLLLELDNLEKDESESNTLEQNKIETDNLEKDESNKVSLPKYISLKNHKDNSKYYLVYDKKTNVNRNTLKLTYNKSDPLLANLNDFLSKIQEKFIV
tara:strand:+ start:2882 stop:3436 length:555 start_codon:yes stop_codon:yes gene_type:complete